MQNIKLKNNKLRYAEYYNKVEMFDKLYFDSLNGKNFTNLMRLITNDNNILLAYRNIKKK